MTGNEMLLEACKNGDLSKVKKLLKRKFLMVSLQPKANVNVVDAQGLTPLFWASENGHVKILELLIEQGADVNVTNKYGSTALLIATFYSQNAVAKLLIANGASLNLASKDGWTPLLRATTKGNREIVELLLARGADVNLADKDGWTPLHWAAFFDHMSLIELLLANGADENARTKDQRTYIEVAKFPSSTAILLKRSKQVSELQGIRIVDTRSEGENQNKGNGRVGKDIPPVAEELYRLLAEARSWGRTHGWPPHDDYPQRTRAREIGGQIDNEFGFAGMQKVAYYIDAKNNDLTSHLAQFWHGIGNWMA